MTPITFEFTSEKSTCADDKGNLQIKVEILVDEVDLHFSQGVQKRVEGFASLESRFIETVIAYFREAENTLLKPVKAIDGLGISLAGFNGATSSKPPDTVLGENPRPQRRSRKTKQDSEVKKRRGRPPLAHRQPRETSAGNGKPESNSPEEKSLGFPKLLKKAATKK